MPRYQRKGFQQRWVALTLVLCCFTGLNPVWIANMGRPLLAANERENSLRIMTWNAYFRNSDTTALRAAIDTEGPDIIAIQEVGAPLADAISVALRERFPFQVLHPSKIPAGLAILSRYPVVETNPPDFDETTGCNCHIVTISVDGQPVTLINTHPWPAKSILTGGKLLEFDTANQDRIFDQLLARLQQAATPLLLTGDLNTMPIQANYRRLSQLLHDAYAESGTGPAATFPVSRTGDSWLTQPLLRIDYIFYDDAWQAQRSWVGTIAGSDHRYVMAELVLKQ